LKHARIPPSINYSAPNPNIDFAQGPFFVNDVLRDWNAGETPRRAGVSSFGIGGTNAHVIVEEAPPRRSLPSSRDSHLIVLSARTRGALERQIGRMSVHFNQHADTDVADAAYTLQIGRREYEYRAAVTVRDATKPAAQLDLNNRGMIISGPVKQTPKICFMFPGQGAQHLGMAKGLYESEPDFRAVFDQCADAFRKELGCDLREVTFSEAVDGADTLNQTSLTQPALFAVEYAMAKFWEGLGIEPDAMIGHSIGEYVAACLAGVMSFADATALVAERARLMQALPSGVMLMVPLPEADIGRYLSAGCSLAAVNGPHICVLSGPEEAIVPVEESLAANDVETRRLHTSHAFHSSMMDPILERFEQRVARVRLSAPTKPYLSNVTGDWIRPEQATDPRYWVEHLRGTVRFGDGVRRLLDDARHLLLEVGPGQVLTTLARRSFGATDAAVPSARHAQDSRADLEVFLQALGTLWTRGCRVNWTGLYSGESRMRVPLPAYAFDRKRYWIDRDGRSAPQAVAMGTEAQAELAGSSQRRAHVGASGHTLAQSLLAIWRQAFGIEAISTEDNFFELGGDSLLATQLTAVVRDQLGVKLRLSDLFENPKFSDLLASMEAQGVDIGASVQPATRLTRIQPDLVNRHQPFPLTDIQQAYWVGRSGAVELGEVATHIYLEVDIKHGDISRFVDAWNVLIDRHDMLRAIFLASGEQQILEHVPRYEFDVIDLEALDEQAALDSQLALRAQMSHQVLPADRWPLFDIKALRSTQHRFRLCISIDILLVDAWSMNMLIEQWLQLYQDGARTLPKIDFSFRDYVIAEHGLQETELYRDSERYWFDRIESLPAAPDLPLAQSPSALTNPNFIRRMYQMDKARWSKLKQRAVAAGLTPSGLLMAAFAEVLGQWSGNPHFTINLTMYSRHPFHDQVDQIVGDFTSLTLLEVDNRTPSTFRVHAERVQKQLWADLDYRYVSAIHVLREMTRRNGSRVSMPIVFTSTLGARALEHESDALDELGEEVFGVSQTSQVWLDHQVMEWKGQLRFNWDAVDALFPEGMVQDMFDAYCGFVERLVDEDDLWHDVAADHLLPEKHRSLFAAVNATDADYPLDLLHRQFEAQAQATPQLAAVIAHDRVLSYEELLALSQGLGSHLRDLGVARAELVGVFLDKGWEQIVSVMGILAAGGAYLPIDPALPEERLAYLVQNSGVQTIVTTGALRDRLAVVCEQRTVVDVHEIAPAPHGAPLLEARQGLDDLAYVIYTSGSTGQPKGVMVPHRGAANTVADINRRIGLNASDRVFALSALNFDLSVYDVFGTLSCGAALVMPRPEDLRDPARWCESIQAYRISVWNSVPALMQILVDHVTDSGLQLDPALRAVVLSGDWIPPALPERLSALWPQTHVLGAGGPTECSIWSASHPVQPEDWRKDSIPYGKPLGNQQIHILNGQLQPCPIWVPGELYVAGDGLALGYLADAVRTDAVFLHHPNTGQRLYKSGDLGRFTPSGDIEFLGRNDFQVKVNGYRVELGEVEAALKQCDAFKDVVVVAAQEAGKNNKSRLVAYLVHESAGDAATSNASAADHDQAIEIDPVQAKLVEFKLTKPGLRPRREGETALMLPKSSHDVAAYRRRKSYREYLGATLTFDRLSDMLLNLSELHDDDMPLPKYRYASAGSLHAVQVYLHVKAGSVEGLAGGCYYYHPEQHSLVRVDSRDELTAAQY
ncbi:MAG: amino acid adenylation domain-containing protein, partial [Lysobacter sp.]